MSFLGRKSNKKGKEYIGIKKKYKFYNWIYLPNNVENNCSCAIYRKAFKVILWKNIKIIMILPPHKKNCISYNPENLPILTHTSIYAKLRNTEFCKSCELCDDKINVGINDRIKDVDKICNECKNLI
jgi:Pyruvate/2-oxoacid:ferredoxin oxidoreductase delta subunit